MQLRQQLGIKRYETAWALERKLRHAMVDPDRNPLKDLVEVDEGSMPFHRKDDPPGGGQGRSHQGKMMLVAAVEARKAPEDVKQIWMSGRIRLSVIEGYTADDLHPFIEGNIAPGSTLKTDGHAPYASASDVSHEPHVIGSMAAHVVLPLVHRLISNLKTWAKGVYHGLRPKYLQSYFDEYVFRFNRRHNRPSGFRALLRIAMQRKPITHNMSASPEASG